MKEAQLGASPAAQAASGMGVLALRWLLLAVMWGLFLAWNFFWWADSTVWFGANLVGKQWKTALNSGHFNGYDVYYILYFVPIVLIAILAPLYLSLPNPPRTSKDALREAKPPSIAYRIWSFPVYKDIRVWELFWWTYVAAFLIWQFVVPYCKRLEQIHRVPTVKPKKPPPPAWQTEWSKMSELFGWTAFMLVNFLFFPVARDSPLLRLIKMPFERAVRYHRWFAFWMLVATLAHTVGYMSYWYKMGIFNQKSRDWRGYDVANLPGYFATAVGLLIGVTSLGYVRRRWFEVFFNVHQLYIVFLLMVFWHVGEKHGLVFTLPGVFLFFFDRMQRVFQSWSYARVLATKTMPDGSIQVEVAKHPRHTFHTLQFIFVEVAKHPRHAFHPLQFIFVNLPGVSRFQWHPFSLFSGPRDSARSFVFHIKPQNLGRSWTDRVAAKVGHVAPGGASKCPLAKLIKTDGFYGEESDSFKRYPTLLMISGGSGIVPLHAVLRDILHSHHSGTEVGLPSKIYLYWAVRDYSQLAPLAELSPALLCPEFASKVEIIVHAYVTRGKKTDVSAMGQPRIDIMEGAVEHDSVQPMLPQITGWRLSLVLLTTFVGTTVLIGAFYHLFVYSKKPHANKTGMKWWIRATIILCAEILGVAFFGGLSMLAIYLLDRRFAAAAKAEDRKVEDETKEGFEKSAGTSSILAESADGEDNLLQTADVNFGQRPVVADILFKVAQQNPGQRIGVLASGPGNLVESVIAKCRAHNPIFAQNEAFFDLHTISYEL
ncbi:Ferric reductase [Klebsormidium nitens]|uniref:Ferric reductase n=1 Tax=Klebsormidium nitens TaxID=105231 RepID=A0A1Y1HR00_KLENI|nr:Ferric reductase [Klebsormidium nitens]|eukprot:GAQ78997.1 Ferric reductase [Klebsormidium nitens]